MPEKVHALIHGHVGGIEARRAQEGRWRRRRGSTAKGPIRNESRLRDDQEEGGRSLGSHAAQQDLQRGHQREPEEAIREWRNLRASTRLRQPRAAWLRTDRIGQRLTMVADIHWPRAGLSQPVPRLYVGAYALVWGRC